MMRECLQCGDDFVLYPGKKGYIWQCDSCATDIETFVAEQGTGDDGTVESITNNPRAIGYLKEIGGYAPKKKIKGE